MGFYSALYGFYDQIFPFDEDVFGFLVRHFSRGHTVVDIACGTGTYSLRLADSGYTVTAFDSDPNMVAKAKAKRDGVKASAAGGKTPNPDFYVRSMEEDSPLPGSPFDCAFCIGNSLVHLPGREAVLIFLKNLKRFLVPGGAVLFQIINYDRIILKGLKGLPPIAAPGLLFERHYELRGGIVLFRAKLTVNDGNPKAWEQETPLLALTQSELTGMMEEAGFRNITVYGSFKGEAFDKENSVPLIVLGKAPGPS